MGCNCGGARYRPPQQPSVLPRAVGLPTTVIVTAAPPPQAAAPRTQEIDDRPRGGYIIPPNGGPGGLPSAS